MAACGLPFQIHGVETDHINTRRPPHRIPTLAKSPPLSIRLLPAQAEQLQVREGASHQPHKLLRLNVVSVYVRPSGAVEGGERGESRKGDEMILLREEDCRSVRASLTGPGEVDRVGFLHASPTTLSCLRKRAL